MPSRIHGILSNGVSLHGRQQRNQKRLVVRVYEWWPESGNDGHRPEF